MKRSHIPDIEPRPAPPGAGPAPARARRLAVGSLHGEHPAAASPAREALATWRAALWIGGLAALPWILAIAGLVLVARAASPLSAELVARSWLLLVPAAIGLATWSALVALRHAASALAGERQAGDLAGGAGADGGRLIAGEREGAG